MNLKRIRLKAVAWSAIVILFSISIGLSSLHYLNAEAKEEEKLLKNEATPVEREVIIDSEIDKKPQEKKQPMQGLFETTMETVNADGKIGINFGLKNISGKNLKITHGSGRRYDIWVYNEQNEEVYRWSLNKAFTLALIERELKKSGEITFNEEWNLLDNEGKPVPAGKYTLEVKVMIGLESETINPDELTAKSTIEIK
jgi:hypothetical protein